MIRSQFKVVSVWAVIVFFIVAFSWIFLYLPKLSQSQSDAQKLTQKVKDQLGTLLKVYTAYDRAGVIKLIRHGRPHDGGYVAPEKAFLKADVLLGYGIADDNSFEEQFSTIYHKPSYGFDCGIDSVASANKLFTFVRECIANDKYIYSTQTSSMVTTTFTQQLNRLGLVNKKFFIKMDIEGAEYAAFTDILKYHKKITGIVVEIHFRDQAAAHEAIHLLRNLQKNFILVHVHGNNFASNAFMSKNSLGRIPQVLELTYINKALVDNYQLSTNQKHPLPIDMPNWSAHPDYEFTLL